MKKSLIITIFFLVATQFLISEQIDNIILLDTSESMFPYFSGTIDYIIEDIVKDQLQSGDTFHLLSFNNFPEYEISRTIRSEEEIEDIFKRIFLLQPLGKYTDLISAFSFLYEYTKKLQLHSIKKIIILTDGIHDPPPGSPYPVSTDNTSYIVKISGNMRREGWKVSLIQFPLVHNAAYSDTSTSNTDSNGSDSNLDSSDNKSSENNLFPVIAETLDEKVISFEKDNDSISHDITGAPEIIFPSDLGTIGQKFNAEFIIVNHSLNPVLLKLSGINFNNSNLLENSLNIQLDSEETKKIKLILLLPDNFNSGSYETDVELMFEDNYRAYPRKGTLIFNFDPKVPDIGNGVNTRFILYIIIGIVSIIALIYIIINIVKSMGSSSHQTKKEFQTNKTQQESIKTIKTAKKFKNDLKNIKPGHIAIEMIVTNQNRQIGHRNIHHIGDSQSKSVGGAGSEYFLIFIIETGKRIGEIVMENEVISFIPKNKEFFPDLGDNKLINCLSKPIRVLNKNGIETTIVFNEWISPIDRLNKIMHLVDRKGVPNFKY